MISNQDMSLLRNMLSEYFPSCFVSELLKATEITPKVLCCGVSYLFVLSHDGTVTKRDLVNNTNTKLEISGVIDIVDLFGSVGLLTKIGETFTCDGNWDIIWPTKGPPDVVQFVGRAGALCYFLQANGRVLDTGSKQIKDNIIQLIRTGSLFLALDADGEVYNIDVLGEMIPTRIKRSVNRIITEKLFETIDGDYIALDGVEPYSLTGAPILQLRSCTLYKNGILKDNSEGLTIFMNVLSASQYNTDIYGITTSNKVFSFSIKYPLIVQWLNIS